VIEILRVDQWLYGKLNGDTTLMAQVTGVYNSIATQDAPMPYALFSFQGAGDVRGVGPTRIMTRALYQVKVVGAGASYAPLKAAVDRIDTLLQGASGSVTDGKVFSCVREQPIAFIETAIGGAQFRHAGGLYRIVAQ
jgi:hypothetical protein